MRVSAHILPLAACLSLAIAGPSRAAPDGIYLPSAPSGPGGEDTISSATGTRCQQSMNSNGAYLDLGITARAASPLPDDFRGFSQNARDATGVAYARITVPLGKRPQRIDCSRVYELELERLRQEVELMRMNAE